MDNPWGLDYWQSEDWKSVQGRLNDATNPRWNPSHSVLFSNLRDLGGPSEVRCVLIGQDPYPDPKYATGTAFSIPRRFGKAEFPLSLRSIFQELVRDIKCPFPAHGDLSGWVKQGVLLINAIPTCEHFRSKSHDWREYHALTREILQRTSESGAVHCFLGGVARGYVDVIGRDDPNNPVIEIAHPAHRFHSRTGNPFRGSRVFSRINEKLVGLGKEPIDWDLNKHDGSQRSCEGTSIQKTVLPNLSGTPFPLAETTQAKDEIRYYSGNFGTDEG